MQFPRKFIWNENCWLWFCWKYLSVKKSLYFEVAVCEISKHNGRWMLQAAVCSTLTSTRSIQWCSPSQYSRCPSNTCCGWSFGHALPNFMLLHTLIINNVHCSMFNHHRRHPSDVPSDLFRSFSPCSTSKWNRKHFKFWYLNYDKTIYNLPT